MYPLETDDGGDCVDAGPAPILVGVADADDDRLAGLHHFQPRAGKCLAEMVKADFRLDDANHLPPHLLPIATTSAMRSQTSSAPIKSMNEWTSAPRCVTDTTSRNDGLLL